MLCLNPSFVSNASSTEPSSPPSPRPCVPGNLGLPRFFRKEARCHRRVARHAHRSATSMTSISPSSLLLHCCQHGSLLAMASAARAAPVMESDEGHVLPFKVNSSFTVESWGTLYSGPNESRYWNCSRTYPYPVGYTSVKIYKGRKYRQTIKEGPNGPLFVVEDSSGRVFSSISPQKVWEEVAQSMGLQVHGYRHFGFQNADVVKYIWELVGDTKKEGQIWEGDEDTDKDRPVTWEGQLLEDGNERSIPSMFGNALFDDHRVEHKQSNILEEDDEDEEVIGTVKGEEEDDEEEAGDAEVDEDDVVIEVVDEGEGESEEVDDDVDVIDSDDDDDDDDDDGELLTKFKDSFQPETRGTKYVRASRGPDSEKYIPSVGFRSEAGGVNNAPFYPQASRSKNFGIAEKQVWRKSDGLPAHGASYERQQQLIERPANDHWSAFTDAAQPRTLHGLSNGTKSWDGPFPRKKEENLKSSQQLLELLQRWNKIKKWNHDSGDRLQARVMRKQAPMREEHEFGRSSQSEGTPSDERSFNPMNKSFLQNAAQENNHPTKRGSVPGVSSFQGLQGSSSSVMDNANSVLDELRVPDVVDESTDYAISQLFETVGKKSSVVAHDKSEKPSGEISKVLSHGTTATQLEKSIAATQPEKLNSLQIDANYQGIWNFVQDDFKAFDIPPKPMVKTAFERPVKETTLESKKVSSHRLVEALEKTADIPKRGTEEIRRIEDVRKLALDKRFEDALLAIKGMKASGMTIDEDVFEAVLGFRLDSWQRNVSKLVKMGNSVLVSAPAGAGKLAAAECCLYRSIVEEQRVLLVTPYDIQARILRSKFVGMFGPSIVGGVGTRMRAQKDQKLVVLTLETLAKILQELSGPGGSEFRFFLDSVKMIVFDKFHTFGEAKYNRLWEEVLMLLDSKIKIVALTLPANNEDEVASWIDTNRGPCKLVSCPLEPVPKKYLFGHNTGIFPLLDSKGSQLKDAFFESQGAVYGKPMTAEEIETFFWTGYDKVSLKYALSALEESAMLPAIVVCFNAKGCGEAMLDASSALGEGLLSKSELEKVEIHLTELKESHPDLYKHIDEADREGICKGIATYHQGKLPTWQNLVLKLFEKNLVKLLIATDSILLNTEIAAHTIILPATCKVTKDGVLSIPFQQLFQLVGNAGRRGYDVEGNVIFLRSFQSGPKEAASLLLDNAFNLSSCFKPSYSLVVNLMAKHKLSEAKKILGRSFCEFVSFTLFKRAKRLEELDRMVLNALEEKAVLEVKLYQGLSEVNKVKLADAAMFTRVDIRMTIHSASFTGNALPGVLLAVVPGQSESYYMVFGADNNFRLLPAGALDHVYTKEIPSLDDVYRRTTGQVLQPPLIPPKDSWLLEHEGTYGYVARGNLETKEFVRLLMEFPVQASYVREGLNIRKEIMALEARLSNLIEKRRSLELNKESDTGKAESLLEANDTAFQSYESEVWKESQRLSKILEKVDALSVVNTQGAYVKLKPLGMLISRLHNVENELWLAVLVTSKLVRSSLPVEFIGIIATVIPPELDVGTSYADQRELLYRITKPTKDAFANLELLRKQVAALQGSYSPPLQFDTMLAGMVYAWARGKPKTSGFEIVSTNDGDIVWKLRSVTKIANLVYKACSQVSVDMSEPNDFNNLSMLARRAEDAISRHLTAVDGKI